MSRYEDYDDDESFPNQFAFWSSNAHRALKGKRGRKVLAELRDALMALPEKRLISGAMCTVGGEAKRSAPTVEGRPEPWFNRELRDELETQGEGVCAIGAYLWHRKVKAGADPVEAFDSLPTVLGTDDGGLHETANIAKAQAGVVMSLAWELAYRNDETFDHKTPEERHAAFIEWIDAELATA